MKLTALTSRWLRTVWLALIAVALVAMPNLAAASEHGEHAEQSEHGEHADEGAHGDHGGHGESGDEDEEPVESSTGYHGVKLGEFCVRSYRPSPMRRDDVDFKLHAAVKSENYKVFAQLYEHRAKKVRDQVITATRLVPVESYDDPELTMLRRRILLRLRRVLPELKIDDVYISEFSIRVEGI